MNVPPKSRAMRIIHGARSFDHEEFLRRPLFAHLATAAGEGPRDSPVWFVYEDEAFWIIGDTAHDTFPGRVAARPACALGIVDFDRATGLVQHVAVRGTAEVVPFDAERARRIFRKYMGDEARWDPRFLPTVEDVTDTAVFVRVVPETMLVRDQSYRPRP